MHDFLAKYKRCKERTVLCTVEPESLVKLLVRISERIKIIYITIIFVSSLVPRPLYMIKYRWALAALSWLTLLGCLICPFEQPKQLHGHLPGNGHLPEALQ